MWDILPFFAHHALLALRYPAAYFYALLSSVMASPSTRLRRRAISWRSAVNLFDSQISMGQQNEHLQLVQTWPAVQSYRIDDRWQGCVANEWDRDSQVVQWKHL